MARLKTLTTDNLAVLDEGKVREALDYHIGRMAKDCADRPGEPKARTITMQIAIEPVCDQRGEYVAARAQVRLHSVAPKHQTGVIDLRPTSGGTLAFNPAFSDAADQEPMFADEDDD